MSNDQERALERFTFALLDVLDRTPNATIEFKRAAFEEACNKAVNLLSKDEIVKILMFVVFDHENFFTIFEQSAARYETPLNKV